MESQNSYDCEDEEAEKNGEDPKSTDEEDGNQAEYRIRARPVMSKAAKLDKLLEKKRFGDEYEKPIETNPW